MAKVAVVTDSTGCIPADMIGSYPITVVPQVLIWGSETFQDGVDIQPTEFYQRLAKATVMPSSSQVSPGTLEKTFRDLLAQDYHILAVLISEKLSGTIASAVQAKRNIGEDSPIEIMDSYFTAMAMGCIVLESAKLSVEGASLAECKALVEKLRPRCGIYLTVDTLEFLHRGGRIGGATRFLGTALNLKPIMKVVDGRIEPLERVRTRSKSLNRLLELVVEDVGDKPVQLSVLNANAQTEAQALLDQAKAKMNVTQGTLSDVSPVIGAHVGPGTLGITFMTEA
jgi:DegV family protein with EDD domain